MGHMRMTIAGLELTHGEDGFWLHFDGGNKKGAIHLENTFKFNILHDAVMQWANSQTEIDMNMLAAPSERDTLVALLEMEARRAVVDRHNYVECGDGLCGCGHGIEHPCHSKRPAPAEGAKDQTQRFPIDRTDAYEERIDAERQAPRAESQDTIERSASLKLWELASCGRHSNRYCEDDFVYEMTCKYCADNHQREVKIEELTATLAVARRGYVKLEDVREAIVNEMYCKMSMPELAERVVGRLTTQSKETKG